MIVSEHPILSDGLRLACSRTRDAEIVYEALSVAQALQGFNACKPEVVIVDLQLPQARRVIRRLRALRAGVPILALTTASQGPGLANGENSAVVEVPKTFRSKTIVDMARKIALAEKNTL